MDFALREPRIIGAGITHFYVGDSFHFITDGFTDILEQPKNAGFWSSGGKDFDEDLDALEKLTP